jgi:hypothetical protein
LKLVAKAQQALLRLQCTTALLNHGTQFYPPKRLHFELGVASWKFCPTFSRVTESSTQTRASTPCTRRNFFLSWSVITFLMKKS